MNLHENFKIRKHHQLWIIDEKVSSGLWTWPIYHANFTKAIEHLEFTLIRKFVDSEASKPGCIRVGWLFTNGISEGGVDALLWIKFINQNEYDGILNCHRYARQVRELIANLIAQHNEAEDR